MAETTTTERKGIFERTSDFVWKHGTFFRIHATVFTIVPLIAAGVFYGCNGRYHVPFIDCLFLCYSAMTVTGLSTVNLSTTTAWQQTILFLLMLMGDFTVVSWIMVLVRKWYFKNVCEYVNYQNHRKPKPVKSRSIFFKSISSPVAVFKQREEIPAQEKAETPTFQFIQPTPGVTLDTGPERVSKERHADLGDEEHILGDVRTFSSSPRAASVLLSPVATQSPRGVNFALSTSIDQQIRLQTVREGVAFPRRTATVYSSNRKVDPQTQKFEGFGGFPGPFKLAKRLFKRGAPTTFRKIERKLTLPYVETLEAKKVPWLSFDGLVVGRNSAFRTETLSDDQLEVIGGVEYRALRLLSYLIPAYFVGTQLFSFILFAPWISTTHKYDAVFEAQPRLVQKPWFSLFLVLSSYSGGGLSLVDMGMVPFQTAYLMVLALMFVILAGNHALPIFLRLIIWTWSKIARKGTETADTLSFLLQHPRRCFLYLRLPKSPNVVPNHPAYFLQFPSAVEWAAFAVLDIGLPFYNQIPSGPRALAGLFQGLAARASGLAIVPLASSSPALQFLYVVMMYIAVYPVAMTIRSTNVYESESLGVFEEPPDEADEEPADLDKFEPRERIGRYLLWHVDRQMANDIWWLVCGVFLVAVIERHNIMDDSENKKWFDLFRVVFELVSAFGGIGLTLGVPDNNFAFTGAFRPLSKLVTVCRLRGRHRGLPVGVERAVTLPHELKTAQRAAQDKGGNNALGLNGLSPIVEA
ncbi:Potassium transporter [Mycena indigotica]|uniref:Potassium transporter n=1 Tax=Mycena indigotica TaxID=2126181 RepID=A0A8H6T1C8_9AGAR|nr:Potassium transporter [Mycena indigotica]KAF7309853.1 Potassium transporter [Mycena indigotica]